MKTQSYKVTETAGIYVAGRRSPGAGATIDLTDEQAFYPLIAQEIVEIAPAAEAQPPAKRKAE